MSRDPIPEEEGADHERKDVVESVCCGMRMPVDRAEDLNAKQESGEGDENAGN